MLLKTIFKDIFLIYLNRSERTGRFCRNSFFICMLLHGLQATFYTFVTKLILTHLLHYLKLQKRGWGVIPVTVRPSYFYHPLPQLTA